MMSESLEAGVARVLSSIRNPRIDKDLQAAGMIRDLSVEDGVVKFTFLLGRDDPAALVRQTRSALREVEGVREVRINVADPGEGSGQQTAPPARGAVPPPPTPEEHAHLGTVIAISSGKGGVGKSTVAANLAVAIAQSGKRVGLMDADVYGPNIPRMFGVFEKPLVQDRRIQPLLAWGVKLMSLGFLVERDAPAIWRGPIIMKVVQQFLRDVEWGDLDYFLVDLPPGTGDAQLSLVQACRVSGAIIVTTPQQVAVGDSLRGAKMFERVGVPVLGVVENMSGFQCPECGREHALFGEGGGQRLAEELDVPLLGKVPLQEGMVQEADAGRPVVVSQPGTPAAQALAEIAGNIRREHSGRGTPLPILRG